MLAEKEREREAVEDAAGLSARLIFETIRLTGEEELRRHATGLPRHEGLVRGIPAGDLIAALVWMLPRANGSELALIVLFTWLIALGDFTRIIAGSVEMAFLMVQGALALSPALFRFFLPVLLGDVIGGTAVFTLLTRAQVRPEVREAEARSRNR